MLRQPVLEIGHKLTILTLVSRKLVSDRSAARFAGIVVALTLALTLGVGACGGGPRGPGVITDSDPDSKIRADKDVAQNKDMSAIPQLVKDLESDDPAVRFYAINTLQRLTNQTFGYQYFGSEEQRAGATGQWKAWLAGWTAGQHHNAGQPGDRTEPSKK